VNTLTVISHVNAYELC